MELNVALALPLNAVATHFRSQPNATRTQLLEAACDPYVREIVAACRGDFATTVLAADALAVSFEVGRVVQDTADRDRLCLLPNPDAPEAFRRLLDCIIQKLPSRTHGRAATKNDPSYA